MGYLFEYGYGVEQSMQVALEHYFRAIQDDKKEAYN